MSLLTLAVLTSYQRWEPFWGDEDQDAFTEGSSRKRHGSGGQKREPFLPGITHSELYQERLGYTTMHVPIWWHLLPEHT